MKTSEKIPQIIYDIGYYLQNQATYEAWLSRRISGIENKTDDDFKTKLIETRLAQQQANGSWDDGVAITARYLRELADLGLTKDDKNMRTATWPHRLG